jgi:hypothetical protein
VRDGLGVLVEVVEVDMQVGHEISSPRWAGWRLCLP